MKPRQEQHIIPNVQCHQSASSQMIKRSLVPSYSKLGHQEPSRRFVANDMRVKWWCLFYGLGNNWQLRLRRLEAWWVLMAFDVGASSLSPFRFPLLELIMTPNVVAQLSKYKSVIEYANQLKALWQELDHYRVIKPNVLRMHVLKDFIEQDRVYDFLVGLNPKFDQVRIQILGNSNFLELDHSVCVLFPNWISRGNQRDRDRERGKDDGLTPEQRRERDAKALQEKAAKKAGQAASGGSGDAGGKNTKK
ncbi:hypothetical protein AAG906_006869 [Vitis piasezkii]